MWFVSVASFVLVELIPGDPIANVYGDTATPEQIAHIRNQLGLDKPMVERYASWAKGVLTLNFGETLVPPIRPVTTLMSHAVPVTLQLALMAVIFSLLVGLPLGALAACYEGSAVDKLIGGVSFALLSIPSFVGGLALILLFVFNGDTVRQILLFAGLASSIFLFVKGLRTSSSHTAVSYILFLLPAVAGLLIYLYLPNFPRQGWVSPFESPAASLKHSFLPALAISIGVIPLYAQLLRADMQVTLKQNFIMIARAKGASPFQIVFREALRPSLFSLITVAALSFGTMLAGSVIVETIFNLPGLGKTIVTAIIQSDYVVVQAGVLITAFVFVILNTLVDLTYALLDPRVRRAHR